MITEETRRKLSISHMKYREYSSCRVCGNIILRKLADIKNNTKLLCSLKCARIWSVGKKRSDEFKLHHRIINLGEKNPNWKGGITRDINKYNRISYKEKPYRKISNKKTLLLIKNGGELTIDTIQRVYEDNIKKYGTLTCYLCLKPIEFKMDSLEHKIPLSRGGTNEYCNLGISCKSCNSKKKSKTTEEYLGMLKCK